MQLAEVMIAKNLGCKIPVYKIHLRTLDTTRAQKCRISILGNIVITISRY